jgi:hypothetical protein
MMAIKIIPFKLEHILAITPQDHDDEAQLVHEHYRAVEGQEHSYTIEVNDKVVCCCGAVEYWPGRSELWSVVDRNCGREFMALHRAALKVVDMIPARRLEATVKKDFAAGHRWIKLLGFQLEAETMRAYSQAGSDYSLYARVR